MRHLLFDLDGTLTNPKEGITKSILFALEKLSVDGYNQDSLEWCIGPPLLDSFMKILGGDNERAKLGVDYYREYYKPRGLYENAVYPGIKELLTTLKSSGKTLYIATSKPQIFAKQILDHFDLTHYFHAVYGSELDGTRTNKKDLIAYILQQESITNDCVMIGDREHDIIGAKYNEITSIGITWGYGSADELQKAGAEYICHTPEELGRIIMNLKCA